MVGQELNSSVIGPLGRSTGDIRFLTKELLAQSPWLYDPHVINLPWQESKADEVNQLAKSKGLTFGLLKCDGLVLPHPPVTRVLDELASKLKEAGHEVRRISEDVLW